MGQSERPFGRRIDPEAYRKNRWGFPAGIAIVLLGGFFGVEKISELPPTDRDSGLVVAISSSVIGGIAGFLLYRFSVRRPTPVVKDAKTFSRALIGPSVAFVFLLSAVGGLLEIGTITFLSSAGLSMIGAFWIWAARSIERPSS